MKLFFWIFVFLSSLVFSQEKYDDFKSKEIVLDAILNEITNDDNPHKTIRVADSLINLLKGKKEFVTYKVRAHHIKSVGFYLLQKKDLAQAEINIVLNYFDRDSLLNKKLPDLYTSIYIGASLYEKNKGNFHNSYSLLSKALKNLDVIDYDNNARIKSSLADLNFLMDYKEKAKELAFESINSKGVSNLTKNLSNLTLGNIYKTSNLDSAYYYYNKAAVFFKDVNASTYFGINTNIAEVFIQKGQLKKAEKLLLEAKKYQLKHNDINLLGKTFLNLSKISGYNKNSKLELKFLNKAAIYLKNDIYLLDKEELYKSFVYYYKKQGDFSKKQLYEIKAQIIKDSIHNRENIFLAKELEAKYENLANAKEIKKQNEFIIIQNRQKTSLFIALAFIVVLLIFTIILYRKRLKTQKILLRRQEQLSKEKLKTIHETQKLNTIQSHLDGQNEERKRIAKDLHDSISGNLAAIKMKLSNIDKSHSNQISNIISNIDDTYNEVRLISHNLLPQENTNQNFTQRLNTLINLYKTKELYIEFNVFPVEEINSINDNIQFEIHKILQELMTNITKHAKASKSIINITLHDNYLNFLVEDNGLGLDKTKISSGIGFKNILSRVNGLNGVLEIDSIEGKGVTITINIPITK